MIHKKQIHCDQTRKAPVFDLGPANVWFCDQCGSHGAATFGPETTVFNAVHQIRDAHKVAAPFCIGGTTFIRLTNLERLRENGCVA